MLLLPLAGFANSILDGLEFKHGIAFFHDLKYPADFTHLDYLNPHAPKGGKLVEPSQSNFNTLARRQPGGVGPPSGFWFTYDTLLIRAGDEVSGFYGRLADGVAITDDQMAMVFRIHPDARWQDGVPITSKDVVYTYRLNKNDVQSAIWFEFIDSIEAIDDRHVVIHLAAPVTLNNIIMIQFTSILPEHYWRERDPTARTLEPPLYSGPYRIADLNQGKYIEYELDPNYWGRDIPVNKGRYNFEKVRYEVYRDATVIREAFRKGLLDIWTESDVRYWHSAYDTPALEKGWIKKIRRHFGIEVGVRRSIALNNRLEKFADRRVRQALTLAMDFEWQNRTLHNGYHKRAHSYWPDTLLAATDLPTEDELALLAPFRDQLPAELFERPFRFPEAATNEAHRETMLVARQLLHDAGWQVKDGVLRNQKGEALEIEFLTQSSEDARILLPYFKQLEQLGITSNMRLAESSQYINRLRQFDFDAVMKNQDILMPPVIELKSTYHSTTAFEPTSRNTAGISNPAIDALVTQTYEAVTLEQMVAACRALDRVLLWQYYQIPLHAVDLRRTVHWDKFGIPVPEPAYWPAFPDGWWYDEKKAARIDTAASL
jgi:microcin C transport system substrate-binding protein